MTIKPRRPTPEQAEWLRTFLGVDISDFPDHAYGAQPPMSANRHPPGAPAQGVPPQSGLPGRMPPRTTAAPQAAPSGQAAAAAPTPPARDPAQPFDAPTSTIQIEKQALETIRHLAQQHAQVAYSDYLHAIEKVQDQRKAKFDKEKENREAMTSLVVAIAFIPAGPLEGAIAAGVSNRVIDELKKAKLSDSALTAVEKAFNAETAKGLLEKGADALKEKTVKFCVDSDEMATVGSYLWSLSEAASKAAHNFIDSVSQVTDISAAIAYFSLYRDSLLDVYLATIDQQVTDMLAQIAPVAAQHGNPNRTTGKYVSTASYQEIVLLAWGGQKRLAEVERKEFTGLAGETRYTFNRWVTPDMQAQAAKMSKGEVSLDVFKGQQIPEPTRETGERVVMINANGRARLAIVTVEGGGILPWSLSQGALTFKQWVEDDEKRAVEARGQMQNGGIDTVPSDKVSHIS